MHIKHAILANAVVPQGGKWTIVGTFNTIKAQRFPVIHEQVAIWIRIEGHHSEAGTHVLRVDFVNELGERVSNQSNTGEFVLDPARILPGTPMFSDGMVALPGGLSIPSAGNYDFAIHIDDKYLHSVPVYARQVDERGRIV